MAEFMFPNAAYKAIVYRTGDTPKYSGGGTYNTLLTVLYKISCKAVTNMYCI